MQAIAPGSMAAIALAQQATRLPTAMVARSFSSRSIFDGEEPDNRSQKPKDPQFEKPWDGDEPVAHSVLRMIMDKYPRSIRVEGAARRQIPQPQLHPSQVEGLYAQPDQAPQMPNDDDTISSGHKALLKEKRSRAQKQKRLMNARDAALDYSLNLKYPPTQESGKAAANQTTDAPPEERMPRGIHDMWLLAEERIREAKAKGEFDHLPGRGKPIPKDIHEQSPFLDRTENFLNRIIQRQGAAPPWVMIQQEVDTQITRLRTSLLESVNICFEAERQNRSADAVTKNEVLRRWKQTEQRYFETVFKEVNGKIRSYNVMCPSSVRKNLLDIEKETNEALMKRMKERPQKTCISVNN